jgi:hypothetical protein
MFRRARKRSRVAKTVRQNADVPRAGEDAGSAGVQEAAVVENAAPAFEAAPGADHDTTEDAPHEARAVNERRTRKRSRAANFVKRKADVLDAGEAASAIRNNAAEDAPDDAAPVAQSAAHVVNGRRGRKRAAKPEKAKAEVRDGAEGVSAVVQEAAAVMEDAAAVVESAAAVARDAAEDAPNEAAEVVRDAAHVVNDAATVVKDAAAVVQGVAADRASESAAGGRPQSRHVQDAANVVQSAAAVVQEAAQVVQDTAAVVQDAAAARQWPGAERRRMPRLKSLARHEALVHWKHIVWYIPILVVVIVVGALAIWSFIERQSLVIEPAPLPKVTLVTADPRSRLTAAWVRLLTSSEIEPTLVPADQLEALQGVIVICDIWAIPPKVQEALGRYIEHGGSVAILGAPPSTPIGNVHLVADSGISDTGFKLSESVSPVLARLNPGYTIASARAPVSFLKESPRMTVDARWNGNSRAVVMHMEQAGTRYLWIGFDPDAVRADDRQLTLMLRTAFRWVAGQPVSDGAVGEADQARTLTAGARRQAREERFAFSVDPIGKQQRAFSIRMMNRGGRPIQNPTVKIWLPPGVTQVALAGDLIMKRRASLTGVPEEGACLISLPSLTRNEERVMKIKIAK